MWNILSNLLVCRNSYNWSRPGYRFSLDLPSPDILVTEQAGETGGESEECEAVRGCVSLCCMSEAGAWSTPTGCLQTVLPGIDLGPLYAWQLASTRLARGESKALAVSVVSLVTVVTATTGSTVKAHNHYWTDKMPAKAEDILSGFRVNWMNLRDADTGKILWQVSGMVVVEW